MPNKSTTIGRWRRGRRLAALFLAAGCAGADGSGDGPGSQPAVPWPLADGAGPLEAAACPDAPGLEDAECATLPVPERWGAPHGRRISLLIAVLRATERGSPPAALFVIAGGPGQSIVELAEMVAAEHAGTRRRSDIILVDQRGTGGSNPLRCDAPDPEDPDDELRAVTRACLERHRDSADVRWYTTPYAAEDLEAARRALGYERIDLDGGSYGTRVALIYLKRHPDRARSAVLRGVSPTDYRNPLPFPRAGQRSLDRLFADCAAEPACASGFPDLPAKLDALLARLAREPVTVSIPAADGATREIRIGRDRFVTQLHLLLFLPELAARIPYLIERAYGGDLVPFASLAAAFDAAIVAQIYYGLQLAVVCPEDLARITEDDVARETPGTFLGDGLIRDYQTICRVWPAAPLPADYWEPTRSDVPVLLLSGEIDPSTPPGFGEAAARTLTRSRHVVIPGGTHIQRSECLKGIVEEFLATANPEGVDTSCLAEPARPPYFLGDAANGG